MVFDRNLAWQRQPLPTRPRRPCAGNGDWHNGTRRRQGQPRRPGLEQGIHTRFLGKPGFGKNSQGIPVLQHPEGLHKGLLVAPGRIHGKGPEETNQWPQQRYGEQLIPGNETNPPPNRQRNQHRVKIAWMISCQDDRSRQRDVLNPRVFEREHHAKQGVDDDLENPQQSESSASEQVRRRRRMPHRGRVAGPHHRAGVNQPLRAARSVSAAPT